MILDFNQPVVVGQARHNGSIYYGVVAAPGSLTGDHGGVDPH